MEFKLNKIDTDIRIKLQENIREGKVHGNNSITIKKDLKEDKKEIISKEKNKEGKSKKRFFMVDGVRDTNKELEVNAEKVEFIDDEKLKGHALDVKK